MKYGEIDRARWDATIAASANRLAYACSWFLDAVSPQWEALVGDDYAFVMPLPVKKKFGIKYIVLPRWTQQLGIFSAQPVTTEIIKAFLRKIPYLSYGLNLNYGNVFGEVRPNSVIDLSKDYGTLRQAFDTNTKRNIAKAQKQNLTIQTIDIERFTQFWSGENKKMPLEMHQKLPLLCAAAERRGCGMIRGVFSADNQLIAALFTIEIFDRIIYLTPVSNAEGKQKSAMFFLIDWLLQRHAGSGKLFDCEGSQIPGVARFYAGFGAQPQNYFSIHRCRPQWLINLLHR